MSGSPIATQLGEKLQSYRKQQFTGLVKVSTQNKQQWYLYYILGRIVWTKSRVHSLRRWKRHLAIHSPVFFEQIEKPAVASYNNWNYSAAASRTKLTQRRPCTSHGCHFTDNPVYGVTQFVRLTCIAP